MCVIGRARNVLMVKILNKCILSILVYNLFYRQTVQYFHTPHNFHTPGVVLLNFVRTFLSYELRTKLATKEFTNFRTKFNKTTPSILAVIYEKEIQISKINRLATNLNECPYFDQLSQCAVNATSICAYLRNSWLFVFLN